MADFLEKFFKLKCLKGTHFKICKNYVKIIGSPLSNIVCIIKILFCYYCIVLYFKNFAITLLNCSVTYSLQIYQIHYVGYVLISNQGKYTQDKFFMVVEPLRYYVRGGGRGGLPRKFTIKPLQSLGKGFGPQQSSLYKKLFV